MAFSLSAFEKKKVNFSPGAKKGPFFWREFATRISQKRGGARAEKKSGRKTSTIVCSYRNSFSLWMKNSRSLPNQVNENETCHHVRLKHVVEKVGLSFPFFRFLTWSVYANSDGPAAGSSTVIYRE
jgi:hypothetical protein